MKKRCQILQTHFWVWYFNTLQSHSELQMWKHFAIWCGKTWIKSQCHTFMTNDTSTLSSFPFLWNWAKSDLVKEMCVSCSLAWRNLWHDKRQKFWCYFAISMVIKLMEYQVLWILKYFQGKFRYREQSYMTSDVYRAFLTYLPTLIRYFTQKVTKSY